MDGAEAVGSDSPARGSETGAAPQVHPEVGDAEVVVTTVVDGNDTDEAVEVALGGLTAPGTPPEAPAAPVPPPAAAIPDQAVMGRLAEMAERLAPLEGVAEAVAALRQAARQEFERCAGVLFSHDRALVELNDRLATLASRLESVEARNGVATPAAPAAALSSTTNELYEQALGHILEQLEAFDRRLQAADPAHLGTRMAGLEGRLASLEPVLPVVQALRVTVRAAEDLLAGEIAAREGASAGAGSAAAEALQEMAGRLAALEGRLAPLEGRPDDVAALGRIVRRQLDAVTADSQAKDQVLRRALQKEIERLEASSDHREQVVRETAQRLELLEHRVRGKAQTLDDALAAVTLRLEGMESRLVSVDALGDDIDTLRAAVRRELERLRTSTQSHDQSIAEAGKRFAALDGRLTRLDALPGEVQALRSAMRQEGDRTAVSLRSIEERLAETSDKAFRQLRQLADVVGPLDERMGVMASELESARRTVRTLEVALAETTERLDTLAAQSPGAQVTPSEAPSEPPTPDPSTPEPEPPAPPE